MVHISSFLGPANRAPQLPPHDLKHNSCHEPIVPVVKRSVSPGPSSLTAAAAAAAAAAPPSVRGISRPASPGRLSLPTLARYHSTAGSHPASPENRRTESRLSSAYYTAAWGSPYATPSPRRLSSSIRSRHGIADFALDASPAHSMLSGQSVPSQRDHSNLQDTGAASSNVSQHLYGPLGRRLEKDHLVRQGGKSIKDFTQDWINQYLTGQSRSERTNWLSDDSGDDFASYLTAKNHLSESEGWLGLDDDPLEEDPLKTPTAASSFGRKLKERAGRLELPRLQARHLKTNSTATVKQADFWDFGYDQDAIPTTIPNSATGTEHMVRAPGLSISGVEKPLPPPPDMDAVPVSPAPAPNPKPAPTSRSTPQRTKKRVAWRGKQCVIALPIHDVRGSIEHTGPLLTPADVELRLKKWEAEGYNVRTLGVDVSQSRPAFPDTTEFQRGPEQKNYAVRFPNKAEWDSYVNFLNEEKLRALGVSLGGNDVSPAPVSQTPTQFFGNTVSPPLPTSSAASNHLNMTGNPLAAILAQTSKTLTSSSPFGYPASSPFPSGPASFSNEPGYPFLSYQTPAATTQGTLTPQNVYGLQPSVISPAGGATLPNFGSLLQPVSPLTPDDSKQFSTGINVHAMSHGFNTHHHQTTQLDETGNMLSPPVENRALVVEGNSETMVSSSGPEIAHPTPRGHRHNLSETLQRGVERADFQLESSIRMQSGDHNIVQPHNDLMQSRWAVHNDAIQKAFISPVQNNQQPHSLPQQFFGDQLHEDGQLDGSEIDTNPSLMGTPTNESMHHHNFSTSNHHSSSTGTFIPSHQAKASMSNLNIGAKAFDPTASFSPTNFSFVANNFQPGSNRNNSVFSPISQHSAKSGNFHVNSPSLAGQSTRGSISSRFKFSAASFNVEAPVFNPGKSIHINSDVRDVSVGDEQKIFGSLDSSVIVPPAKKSKAIPIVRPEEQLKGDEKNNDILEDEAGRTGKQGREKRVRRSQRDDDQEVSLPDLADIPASAKQNLPTVDLTQLSDNEAHNFIPLGISIDDELEAETERSTHTTISESTTWKPFEFKNEEDAAAFHAALPLGPSFAYGNDKSPLDERRVSADQNMEDVIATVAENGQKATSQNVVEDTPLAFSNLEPTAALFEFQPATADSPVSAISELRPSEREKVVGLEGSKYIAPSPPISPITRETSLTPEEQEVQVNAGSFDDEVEYNSSDEQEIDAVMRQLNEDDSDLGVERTEPSFLQHSVENRNFSERQYDTPELSAPSLVRSDAPSPSAHGGQFAQVNLPKLKTSLTASSHAMFAPQHSSNLGYKSPIRQLNNPDIDHISEWDDAISSAQDEEFQQRARFFDTHVDEVIGAVLDDRLVPLERMLDTIENSIALLAAQTMSKGTPADVEHSDADDEDEDDEDAAKHRSRSPLKKQNRLIEKIKQAVVDSLVASRAREEAPLRRDFSEIQESLSELRTFTAQSAARDVPPVDFSEVHASLSVLKTLVTAKSGEDENSKMKADIVDSIVNHPKLTALIGASNSVKDAEKLEMQLEGLQNMLRLAEERSDEEYNNRRRVQDSLSDTQRHLQAAEEDVAKYKLAAEAAEQALENFKGQKLPELDRLEKQSVLLNENQESLQLTLSELSQKNITLQGTLDEYRETGDHLRSHLEEVKSENKALCQTISVLKAQMEDGLHSRKNLRGKFEKLQEDMATATRDIARDQSSWRKREEQQNIEYNILKAQLEDEVKRRQKLELHVGDLEQKEREATKLRFILGQSQEENARLEELLIMVRQESHDYQSKAARYEQEFIEARNSSCIEIQRVRTSMEADLDNANHQVNFVRAELENQINNIENQLESTKMDADTAKAKHELMLEEARDSKIAALREAAESKELALQEQRLVHERTLNDLRERHARALHNSSEDRQREESHYMELLALRDEKIDHFHDKVALLEERLEIAKTAARTAAQAAQDAKAAHTVSPSQVFSPSMRVSKGSNIPEKISPQALRESIMVLQDQLQQREGRIEELEHELSLVDKDAPMKIKEKETEITWLRELLHVRLDDLQDIIHVLSQSSFNQSAVRDAAIRLKANLQMQQQEKERIMTGSTQTFPSLASISSLAASPRALPLAAAAAWGNWRKARETNVTDSGPNSADHTPSKTSTSQTFLSGLLTPPNSNTRQLPLNRSAPPQSRVSSDSRPLRSSGRSLHRPSTLQPSQANRQMAEPPRTPPLLQTSSYDHDAESAGFDDAYDNESILGGILTQNPDVAADDGPFGPAI
ncbi:hypothetical protein LOZ09_005153 [Ophidiomyces ophidiicola]|nr:hypothetical protein LOZ09_005153 [Ophidiomyces ophidiicola]